MNIPEGGAQPNTVNVGDLFTLTGNTHLDYQAAASDTEQIAYLSDIQTNNTTLLGATNIWIGANSFTHADHRHPERQRFQRYLGGFGHCIGIHHSVHLRLCHGHQSQRRGGMRH